MLFWAHLIPSLRIEQTKIYAYGGDIRGLYSNDLEDRLQGIERQVRAAS